MLRKSWSFPSTKLIYAAAVLYVLSAYLIPILFLVTGSAEEEGASTFPSWILLVPIILGLVNLTIVLTAKQKIQRKQLLVCSMIIKYGLIPFYIMGGLCIAVSLLLMFTPLVFMIFIGPMLAFMLAVYGWIILLGAAPYSVGYIVRCYREEIYSKALLIISAIMQFFFTMDVIFITVLAIKEKKQAAVKK